MSFIKIWNGESDDFPIVINTDTAVVEIVDDDEENMLARVCIENGQIIEGG